MVVLELSFPYYTKLCKSLLVEHDQIKNFCWLKRSYVTGKLQVDGLDLLDGYELGLHKLEQVFDEQIILLLTHIVKFEVDEFFFTKKWEILVWQAEALELIQWMAMDQKILKEIDFCGSSKVDDDFLKSFAVFFYYFGQFFPNRLVLADF